MEFFEWIQGIDLTFVRFVRENLSNGFLDVLMPLVTLFGEAGIVPIVLALIMMFFKKTRKAGICVLAAIKYRDSYGYQIIKDMKPYMQISESTLYPILRRLEEGKFLSVYSVEHNGRLRKYYHIEKKGMKRLNEFTDEWKEIMDVYSFITREADTE